MRLRLSGVLAVTALVCGIGVLSIPTYAQIPKLQQDQSAVRTARYDVLAVANGVSGCTDAGGCWTVNGGSPVARAAGLTQSVTLFQLPANSDLLRYRYKTSTACTGTTTLFVGLGTAASPGLFLVSATGYDLKAAVADTNISVALPLVSIGTAAATNIVASLTATVDNLTAVANGCAFTAWITSGVLP